MKMVRLMTLVVAFFLPLSSWAGPAPQSPTKFLKAKNVRLESLVKDPDKNKQKIVKTVGEMLDFDRLAKDSLGKHWDGKTDQQRKEFTQTLRSLIEKNLVDRLKKTKKHKISYEAEKVSGDEALVTTYVVDPSDPRAEKTEVEYKLRKQGAAWIAVDMVTDGISLVENYRSQFNKIISKDGWEVLMKKMKDKLAETSSN